MDRFRAIAPEELENVFRLVGKDWMLITAKGKNGNGDDVINTMTASWGGMGVLWNKPVAFCFIRPQRYTHALTEQSERFSLSFFSEEYRGALRLCGTKSGREIDKFAATGLTPTTVEDTPYVKEARLVLICRKLYADQIKEDCFVDQAMLEHYPAKDYHTVYVYEIEEVLIAD